MFVNVVRYLFHPCFFLLYKLIVEVVEFRKLLEQRHKLVLVAVALYGLMMFQIHRMGIIDELRQVS